MELLNLVIGTYVIFTVASLEVVFLFQKKVRQASERDIKYQVSLLKYIVHASVWIISFSTQPMHQTNKGKRENLRSIGVLSGSLVVAYTTNKQTTKQTKEKGKTWGVLVYCLDH